MALCAVFISGKQNCLEEETVYSECSEAWVESLVSSFKRLPLSNLSPQQLRAHKDVQWSYTYTQRSYGFQFTIVSENLHFYRCL